MADGFGLDSLSRLLSIVDPMSRPPSRPPRVRLFSNRHLEKLTLISPRTFAVSWAVFLPLIAWVGWGSASFLSAFGLAAAGMLGWTLFEYLMHRHLFHLETEQPALKWLVYLIHGNHHDDPNDPLRGLMPLVVSVPVGGLIWLVSVAAFGRIGTWPFLGFMSGYVVYDGIHYACHQWPMRRGLSAMLKRHHMRHHYVGQDGNFAISALFWDSVFGTRIRSLRRPDAS